MELSENETEDIYLEDTLDYAEDVEVPDDFDATEAETFASLLSIQRDANRKAFADTIHKRQFTSAESRLEGDEEKRTFDRVENYDKNRESIVQTYHDFLEYRKYNRNQSRIKEFEKLGYKLPTKKDTRLSRTIDGIPSKKKREQFTKQRPHSDEIIYDHADLMQTPESSYDWSDILSDRPIDFSPLPKSVKFPVISTSTSDESEEKCPIEKTKEDEKDTEGLDPKVEYLVKDKYYPGLLDDAVNRKVDYYKICFDLSFTDGVIPNEEPENMLPSLIEAFDMRFNLETDARRRETEVTAGVKKDDGDGEDDDDDAAADKDKDKAGSKSFLSYLKKIKPQEKLLNRDEVRVANAVELDLLNVVRNRPDSDLIQAINSLFKAEMMNEFDKSQQEAEEAFKRAPPEFAESAAVYRAEMFRPKMKDQKKKSHIAHTKHKSDYHPIEVISYMGVTKPNQSINNPFVETSFSRTKI